MAKIVLISQRWTEPVSALAASLIEQKHDVTLITDRSTLVKTDLDLQIMNYFKRWSAWEAIKLFPRLLSFTPDVWHFIFTEPIQEKPRSAHWTLAAMAQGIPRRAVAASIYGSVLPVKDLRWKPFLALVDFVTLGTRESLMSFKRRSFLSTKTTAEVLPPLLLTNSEVLSDSKRQDLERLTRALSPYLVVFSDRLPQQLRQTQLLRPYNLFFLGSRSPRVMVDHCYFLDENDDRSSLELLAQKSSAILIAFDDLSVLELVRIQEIVKKTNTPVICNVAQVELCPGLAIHKKTGWVIDPEVENLQKLISENHRLTLPPHTNSEVQWNPVDHTMNELNRLYNKAIESKT